MGAGRSMPQMNFTSHTKKSSTRMGMRQEVTSVTARASRKRLRSWPTRSARLPAAWEMPSVTLEKRPERPLFASLSVFSSVALPMASVVCMADSTVASMEARYVVSIESERKMLVGMMSTTARAKSASFLESARSVSRQKKRLAASSRHAAAARGRLRLP